MYEHSLRHFNKVSAITLLVFNKIKLNIYYIFVRIVFKTHSVPAHTPPAPQALIPRTVDSPSHFSNRSVAERRPIMGCVREGGTPEAPGGDKAGPGGVRRGEAASTGGCGRGRTAFSAFLCRGAGRSKPPFHAVCQRPMRPLWPLRGAPAGGHGRVWGAAKGSRGPGSAHPETPNVSDLHPGAHELTRPEDMVGSGLGGHAACPTRGGEQKAPHFADPVTPAPPS